MSTVYALLKMLIIIARTAVQNTGGKAKNQSINQKTRHVCTNYTCLFFLITVYDKHVLYKL